MNYCKLSTFISWDRFCERWAVLATAHGSCYAGGHLSVVFCWLKVKQIEKAQESAPVWTRINYDWGCVFSDRVIMTFWVLTFEIKIEVEPFFIRFSHWRYFVFVFGRAVIFFFFDLLIHAILHWRYRNIKNFTTSAKYSISHRFWKKDKDRNRAPVLEARRNSPKLGINELPQIVRIFLHDIFIQIYIDFFLSEMRAPINVFPCQIYIKY